MNQIQAQTQTMKSKNSTKVFVFIGILLFLVISGMVYLDISLIDLVTVIPDFLVFFFTRFFPPNFSEFFLILPDLIDTILYAYVATIISSIVALIFGILMSKRLNPIQPIRLIVRGIVSFLRNVPVIIWASTLVYIFGIGSLVAIIALVINTIGFLSKSYADSIDDIPQGKLEPMIANGASKSQIIYHAIVPMFLPDWINWTLFAFEINVRASSILGLVGAGGIGILIQTRINLFKYQEAMAMVIYIIILVLITEYATNKLRTKLK
ncbi:phosphonate ABC transporter, permease protein PhnE [Fundicoccus culcitae]|uniref:Phosphonate ABC transporter, permease protein PhnE n=1 Tax=Fundicoccus culcitae TaxID=2969821 RepID=A0ABY5P207_9LACT|nr:phosphonate ABC transporter, permease protein PhnE [Fundicoccus culcitae]UUX32747.1 phosphonate ABC transporter, permease protein PhnE [Fundicoccus culcitae]